MWFCIADICENRLELAIQLGATHSVCVKDKKIEDLVEEIRTKTGRAPDVAIECSGAAPSVKLAIMVRIILMFLLFKIVFELFHLLFSKVRNFTNVSKNQNFNMAKLRSNFL